MRYLTGNIFDHVSETGGTLIHQVNCRHVAGAGLARQVRYQYPHWYTHYVQQPAVLGHADLWQVATVPPIYIASLYAQYDFGTTVTQTESLAFEQALAHLVPILPPGPVYVPYRIGCGLGGGTWAVIVGLLDQYLPDATCVRLPT